MTYSDRLSLLLSQQSFYADVLANAKTLVEDADREIAEKDRKVAMFKEQLSIQEQRTGEWHEACKEAEALVAEKDREIAAFRLEFEHKVEEIDRLNQILRTLMPEPA